MKAFGIEKHGDTPRFIDRPTPMPGPGEVQIAVSACGLNFADLLTIDGKYQEKPPLPVTLGMEIAGTVTACGPGVTGWRGGMRVAAFPGTGGLARHAVVPASRCVALPACMPFVDAAAFQVAYGTSHLALTARAGLRAGESLTVLGAAGGVGLTAVEIGARMGARVIAVARGDDKLAVARAAGADTCIDSSVPDLRDALKAEGGVDVVYDAVGDPLASAALKACRPGGRFLAIGFAAGNVPSFPLNYLLVKNLTVHGFYWGGYPSLAPDRLTASLSELLGWYENGGLRPHVSHTLPLDRAADALDLLRSRKSTGKVVVTI